MPASLRDRMTEEDNLMCTLSALAAARYYEEHDLVAQLTAPLPGGDYFSPDELWHLEQQGVQKHWEFVALPMRTIHTLFPHGRWQQMLTRYVATFGLMPGKMFIEDDRRVFRGQPLNHFDTVHGPVLRTTLRDLYASQAHDPEELRHQEFVLLQAYRVVYVADVAFGRTVHDNQVHYHGDVSKILLNAGRPSEARDALLTCVTTTHVPLKLRPTAAEQAVLDSLPR